MATLLDVRNLMTTFQTAAGVVRAVDGVSWDIQEGETVARGGGAGWETAMIFQEPMPSLNPVLTIGRQLTEGLEIHLNMTPEQSRARAIELLAMVGIPDPERRLAQYPHHFSGGMRQRLRSEEDP